MYEFWSNEWWELKSRKTFVVSIPAEQMPEGMFDPNVMRGTIVKVNSIPRRVTGVETFAIPRSETSPYRHGFGLMVKEV